MGVQMVVAVVTGGGSGIGRATAVTLSLSGRYEAVIIVGRRSAPLEETARLASPALVEPCVADISSDAGIAAVAACVGERQVSALVHSAATIEPIAPVMELTRSDWHAVMAINVEAPVFLTKALISNLEGAKVMIIGSDGAAETYVPGLDLYSISKHSLKFVVAGLRDQL